MKLLFHFLIRGEIRCVYWYTRYLVGLQDILPAKIIHKIPVRENDEILVDIRTTIPNSKYVILGSEIPFFEIRYGVAHKILEMVTFLEYTNSLHGLYINCLYRDLELQSKRFRERQNTVYKLHPEWTTEQVESEAKKYTARPSLLSPHVTGAAIDVCLFDLQTREKLIYGTEIGEMNAETIFENEQLNKVLSLNRKNLRNLMEQFGFNCYPGEWWHYSYGDQMWAAYKGKTYAIYGGVESVSGGIVNLNK